MADWDDKLILWDLKEKKELGRGSDGASLPRSSIVAMITSGYSDGWRIATAERRGTLKKTVDLNRKTRKSMKTFLHRCTILVALTAVMFSTMVVAAEKPNIIVIVADDLGYSDLGCYGGEIATPNIDALAKGGVRFSQMYNSARCCPTRASLITGLYPTQAGIGDFTTPKPVDNKGPGYLGRLRKDCVTLAEILKPGSYRNYYVGKWHMHPESGPIDRGFDEFYGYTNDHSHDQYDRDDYERLPANHAAESLVAKAKENAVSLVSELMTRQKPDHS